MARYPPGQSRAPGSSGVSAVSVSEIMRRVPATPAPAFDQPN
jgi:hypothetical protein